jgi:hypothetical protein
MTFEGMILLYNKSTLLIQRMFLVGMRASQLNAFPYLLDTSGGELQEKIVNNHLW